MTHAHSLDGMQPSSETLCLDFANTISDRDTDLGDYSDLASWFEKQEAITREDGLQLHDEAAQQPDRALSVFRKAVALREAIYHVFSAVAAGSSPSEKSLRSLNRVVSEALRNLRIVQIDVGFLWQWADTVPVLEFPLWLAAHSAANLLTSEQQSRVRQCGSEDCDWLFLDRSKNRSRRWCDMGECGNREKARRARQRQRALATET